jgi:lipopolysaccharide transport system ATP-binding protein
MQICVENLSKRYNITGPGTSGYRTLRESIEDFCRARLGRCLPRRGLKLHTSGSECTNGTETRSFWALKDVSFQVAEGDVVGIVGRNGAGKSTLLKILSRITQPTAGRAELWGRVGSLLEVGTGFHHELTGRENIFLSGAILGMSRDEIRRRFDDIVAFADIATFLDTPVKRYSSGMFVRLAFAVAAHLDTEILVVDEVLAVGDIDFQRKCLGKMEEFSRGTRAVLFVSHNMGSIKSLCNRAILLDQGRLVLDGAVDEAVNRYLNAGMKAAPTGVISHDTPRHRDVRGEASFSSIRMTDLDGNETSELYFGQPFRVHFVCDVEKDIPDGLWEVSVSTLDGIHVTYSSTLDGGRKPRFIPKGRRKVTAEINAVLLPREYTIDLGVHHFTGKTCDYVQRTINFVVRGVAETGNDHYPWPRSRGLVRAPCTWSEA